MAAKVRATEFYASDDPFNGNGGIARSHHKHNDYERFSLLAASNIDVFLQTSIVPQVGVFRGGLSDVLPATDFQSLAVAGSLFESRWMLNYFYLDGDGPLNLGKLKRAAFRLVQNLDILRTIFVPSVGRFLQVVLRTLRPAFHIVDVDDIADTSKAGQQERDRGEEGGLRSSHGLGEPFVEFTLVRHRHSNRHRILLRISHAQYDGVCFPKIMGAFAAAYRGDSILKPPSFANYLRASEETVTSDHYKYWKNLLEGSSMTELICRKGPNYRTATFKTTAWLKRTVHLPPVDSGHITTATVVKSAWAYVLARVSASGDVVFGHTISGRNAAIVGVENMIGPCLNLVPVRVQFGDADRTARSLLYQVQDQQIANMPHEVLGFREIIRKCTGWPAWTYFTSTVQHQNIDQSTVVRLGDLEYQVGCASTTDGDFSDLSILSQRQQTCDGTADKVNEMYEIMLSFAEGGAIPREFAEQVFDMLCDASRLFATNPSATLSSPVEICLRPRLVPFNEISSVARFDDKTAFQCPILQRLSHIQLVDLSTLVGTVWCQVLGLPGKQTNAKGTQTRNNCNNTPSSSCLDLDSSFFALGGDIIGLAQVACLLDLKGCSVSHFEDLIDQPTLRGHMAIVASSYFGGVGGARGFDVGSAAKPPLEIRNATLPVMQKTGKVHPALAKAVLLVRRFIRRNNSPS